MKYIYLLALLIIPSICLAVEGEKIKENGKVYVVNQDGKYLVDTTCPAIAYILIEPSKEYQDKLKADMVAQAAKEAVKPKTEVELLKEQIALLEARIKALETDGAILK